MAADLFLAVCSGSRKARGYPSRRVDHVAGEDERADLT